MRNKKILACSVLFLLSVGGAANASEAKSKVVNSSSSFQDTKTLVGTDDPISIDPDYLKALQDRQRAHEVKKAMDALDAGYAKEQAQKKLRPFSSDEILQNRIKDTEIERAANIPIINSKQIISSENLDVDNPKPIIIRTSPSKVSSIIFFDSTGAPWPIEYALPGDEEMFTITPAGSEKNVATIIAGKNFVQSNAVLGLVGLPTTIVLELQADPYNTDSRKSLRLPRTGPKAKQISVATQDLVENSPPELLSLMNGSKLAGSKLLKLDGVKSGNAYLYNGYIYLTSKYILMWPAALNSASSPTGKNVYKLHKSAKNLIFSVDGEKAYAKIVDF